MKIEKLGVPTTIGELKELINDYPNSTSFGFRNQPLQMLEVVDDEYVVFQQIEEEVNPHICKEFDCELTTMLENIPQNRPLYKDSGSWQIRTDDMEDVLFQQGVEESFFDFIKRSYTKENSFMSAFED
ncbi:MAG: hypothetical protein IPP48_03240 [Chitinophagaceae bacterium]|nr:hypothetical protein [Chitinophagaceae bacterium]